MHHSILTLTKGTKYNIFVIACNSMFDLEQVLTFQKKQQRQQQQLQAFHGLSLNLDHRPLLQNQHMHQRDKQTSTNTTELVALLFL